MKALISQRGLLSCGSARLGYRIDALYVGGSMAVVLFSRGPLGQSGGHRCQSGAILGGFGGKFGAQGRFQGRTIQILGPLGPARCVDGLAVEKGGGSRWEGTI
eukprot:7038933-Pyramimonas_sp.AAC.1